MIDLENCTCANLGWHGKNHASGCAAVMIDALEKHCALLESRASIAGELREQLIRCSAILSIAAAGNRVAAIPARKVILANAKLIQRYRRPK
jgi:hypothetical protein